MLTKLSTFPLAVGVVVAVLVTSGSWRERAKLLWITVCGWWLVQNQIRYGDPFAQRASAAYLRPIGGLGGYLFAEPRPLRLIFVDVPRNVYYSFWYDSGWNQFKWSSPAYIVFWTPFSSPSPALPSRDANRTGPLTRPVLVLITLSVGGLSAVWITSFQTVSFEARLVFTGLPAIGCLAALGLERWKVPVPLRFIGPMIGLVGMIIAIQHDILSMNWH